MSDVVLESSHISIPTAGADDHDVFGPWDESAHSFAECIDVCTDKITLPPLVAKNISRSAVAHSAVLHQITPRQPAHSAVLHQITPRQPGITRVSVSAFDGRSGKMKTNLTVEENSRKEKANTAWNKHLSVGLGSFLNIANSPSPSITTPSVLTKIDITPAQLPRNRPDHLASKSPKNSKSAAVAAPSLTKSATMYYHDSFNSQYQHVALRNGNRDKEIDLKKIYDKAYRPSLKLPKCTTITTIKPQFINGSLPIRNSPTHTQKIVRKGRDGSGISPPKHKCSSVSSGDSEEYFRSEKDSSAKYLKTYTRKKVAMFNSMCTLSRITYSVPHTHWDFRK